MKAYLVQIDALQSGSPVALRFASHDDSRLCHLNATVWWPAIAQLPVLRGDNFGGQFANAIVAPTSEITLSLAAFPDMASISMADARFRLWQGNLGDAWGSFTLLFDGTVKSQPAFADGIARVPFGVDDAWLDEPLLETYTGAGGIEGPDDLEGSVKPLLFGAPRFAPAVLIDGTDNVHQLHDGAIESVEQAFDKVVRLGSSTGDFADLTALIAADIPNGGWATCLALGLVRQGAPADGQLSYHVQGDNAGAGGWVRKPGAIIRRIAEIAGGTVNTGSTTALDTARAYNLSIALTEQTTAREIIQSIADSVKAVARISFTGSLEVWPVAIGSATATLNTDGSTIPAVGDVQQSAVAAPFWRLSTQAVNSWVVHSDSDIATDLVIRGAYNEDRVYRIDDVVQLPDGSTWRWIGATPAAGSLPSDANTNWSRESAALNPTDIGVDDGATRNTKEFNDDLNYADTSGFLARWTALVPNTEGNIAMAALSDAPGGRALVFSAADSGGGDPITSGSMSSSSLHANTTGNSIAALSDGVYNTGASSMGTEAETDPYIIRDLGSVQSVGDIQFAPISSDVEGPLDGAFLTGTLTATSNYGGFSPALPNDGSHLRNGLFSGYDNYHACDTDSSAPTMTFTLASDQYCSVIKLGPVNSGDPQGWSPGWMDGTAVKTKPTAGSFTTRGTASGSANDTLQSFTVDATIGVVTLSRTVAYMAVSELHVLGRKRFSLGALDGVKVRISSLTSPDPTDAGDWTDVATVSGASEGALSTLSIDDDCRHIQFIHIGSDKAVGLSELIVKDPVLGGDTSDSLEYEANTRLLIEPGALYVVTFTVASVTGTANNFEAGISCFDSAGTRTRLNIAANVTDVTETYTVFKGYFRATVGTAVEPASDQTDPCLMPSGTVEIAARFLCDTGNSDFIEGGSVSIDKIDDSTSEAGADQTNTNTPRHEGGPPLAFTANNAGTLDGVQLPATSRVYRKKGTTDVSSTATWAIQSQNGITGGTVTVSDGIVTIPTGVSIAAQSSIVVRSTLNSVAIDTTITLTKTNAAAPSSGGGGTGTVFSTSTLTGVASTSFTEVASGTVHTGSGGQIVFAADLSTTGAAEAPAGTFDIELKWQIDNGGWTDVDSAVASNGDLTVTYDSEFGFYDVIPGAVNSSPTQSSLTADTDYPVRLMGRRTTSTPARTVTLSGTISGTGS